MSQAAVNQVLSVARQARVAIRERDSIRTDGNAADADDFVNTPSNNNSLDSLVERTRAAFRRPNSAQLGKRKVGRPKNSDWRVKLFLLNTTPSDLKGVNKKTLTDHGFGRPRVDGDQLKKVKVNRSWSTFQLQEFISSLYPEKPLSLTGIQFGICSRGARRTLEVLDNNLSMAEIENKVKSGFLYVMPLREIPIQEAIHVTDNGGDETDLTVNMERDTLPDNPVEMLPEPVTENRNVEQPMESVQALNSRPHRTNFSRALERIGAATAHILAESSESETDELPQLTFVNQTVSTLCTCGRTLFSSSEMCLVCEQNTEYENSLAIDRERANTSNGYGESEMCTPADEQVRLERAESVPEEPEDGICLLIKLPNDRRVSRKFSSSSKLMDVRNFVGGQPEATLNFGLNFAGTRLEYNQMDTSLADLGLTQASVIHVIWEDNTAGSLLESSGRSDDRFQDAGTPTVSIRRSVRTESNQRHSPGSMSPPLEAGLSSMASVLDHPNDSRQTLQSVLKTLQDCVDPEPTFANMLNVRRDDVWDGGVRAFQRKRFDPFKQVSIVFVDGEGSAEGAVDDGGPTREFFRLLLEKLRTNSNIFVGPDCDKMLDFTRKAADNGWYEVAGLMIGVSLSHGGPSPNFFSKKLFDLVVSDDTTLELDDIQNDEIRNQLTQIRNAATLADIRDAVGGASLLLAVCGCVRYISTMDDRDKLIKDIVKFLTERLQAPLNQFKCGLQKAGLLQFMQNHPVLMQKLFVASEDQLTVKDVMELFKPHYSVPRGHIKYSKETTTVAYWRDWLLDIDEAESGVTLEDILVFATGASKMPPLGFPVEPSIQFRHPDDCAYGISRFPLANTCSLTLSLPVVNNYKDFSKNMEEGILQCHGFGFA